ncbi:MAG: DUF1648 domain-containing protein [Clostridiales bacterium]|jgi:uncharacterized membrane protein|nr:DUF1648 domain-containing protein [Clostridiales bacterium]
MSLKRLINCILACIPLIITVIVLPLLPDRIPAHYDFSGNITRYGSKYETLIIPIVAIVLCFFWLLLEKHLMRDAEKGPHNVKAIFWISLIINIVFIGMTAFFLYSAHNEAVNKLGFEKAAAIAICISWIIIGNILPKIKQNGLVGIRTPWTLASESNWYKTHRMGGKIAVITGSILGLLCLFILNGEIGLWIALGSSIAMIVPMVLYSYLLYKREG